MAKLDLSKEISLGSLGGGKSGGVPRGKIPTKTSINLVIKKESFFSSRKAIPFRISGWQKAKAVKAC